MIDIIAGVWLGPQCHSWDLNVGDLKVFFSRNIVLFSTRDGLTLYFAKTVTMQYYIVSQVRDLSLQVRALLKEVETAGEVDVDDTGDENAEQNRLVIFKNIDQLQDRNAELLSLVREMTAERESAEIHLVSSTVAILKI